MTKGASGNATVFRNCQDAGVDSEQASSMVLSSPLRWTTRHPHHAQAIDLDPLDWAAYGTLPACVDTVEKALSIACPAADFARI